MPGRSSEAQAPDQRGGIEGAPAELGDQAGQLADRGPRGIEAVDGDLPGSSVLDDPAEYPRRMGPELDPPVGQTHLLGHRL
jgi:hypothetical protein